MSTAAALRDATAQAHRDAESRDMQRQLISGKLPHEALVLYLAQLHRLHAALERQFDAHRELAAAVGFSDDARHSRRLEADLEQLGVGVSSLETLPATLRLLADIDARMAEEPATLLGFFYVLEGSMNGNRFIVKALRHTPAGDRCGFTYFDPYGEAQPQRWQVFKAALDQVQLDERTQQRVIEAALRLFDGIAAISDNVVAAAPQASATSAAPRG